MLYNKWKENSEVESPEWFTRVLNSIFSFSIFYNWWVKRNKQNLSYNIIHRILKIHCYIKAAKLISDELQGILYLFSLINDILMSSERSNSTSLIPGLRFETFIPDGPDVLGFFFSFLLHCFFILSATMYDYTVRNCLGKSSTKQ